MARQSAIVVMLARVVADWLGIGERVRVVVAIVVMLARVVVVGVRLAVVVAVGAGVVVGVAMRRRTQRGTRSWSGPSLRSWSGSRSWSRAASRAHAHAVSGYGSLSRAWSGYWSA